MDPSADRLSRHFGALAEPPLPATVWSRVERSRTHRMRLRNTVAVVALAAVAALPFALIPSAPAPAPMAPSLAADPVGADAATAALRALDRELQAAYDRNASPTEIALLWQARRALAEGDSGTPQPVRI